eukprot:3956072-Amphidinium_carterae.1
MPDLKSRAWPRILQPRGAPSWQTAARQRTYSARDGVQLRAATWNALSLDRESLDSVGKGVAVVAGLTWIGKQCRDMNLDLVGIQESRINTIQEHFTLQSGYTVIATPARKGQGGLLLLMLETKHLVFDAMTQVSDRVLAVHARLYGAPLRIVVAHAPVRDSPDCEHERFKDHFALALQGTSYTSKVVVLADMNLRVRGLTEEYAVIGPRALSSCKLHAAHGRGVLAVCNSHGLFYSNTYAAEEKDHTWTHPRGHRVQIDYVMLTAPFMSGLMCTEIVPASMLACVVQSDHDMVIATVMLEVSSRQHGDIARRRTIRTAEQKSLFKTRLTEYAANNTAWLQDASVAPEHKLDAIDEALSHILDSLPKPKDHPKNPWISDRTWTEMQRLNALRRAASAYRRSDDLASLQCSVAAFDNSGLFWEQASSEGLPAACSHFVKLHAKRVRKLLVSDKRSWFHDACANIDNPYLDKAEMHAQFKRLCHRNRKRQVKLLCSADGVASATIQQSNELWAEHWQQQLSGVRLDGERDCTRQFDIAESAVPDGIMTAAE